MRSLKWIALAGAGIAVALGLAALNQIDSTDPLHGFRSAYIWVLASAWIVLMISAIFVEKRRR
jgi:hypothetical protein